MKNILKTAIKALGLSAIVALQTANAQSNLKPLDPVKCLKVGSNINIVSNGSFFPFVDVFKCNTGWSKDQYATSIFDKDGYKINGATQTTTVYLDEFAANTEFTILWEGAPKDTAISPLKISGMSTTSFYQNSKGGSMKAQKTAGILYLTIVNSQITTDLAIPKHIRNIRIIRKGFENTYLTNPFNPEFLEQVKDMSYLKVNQWMSNYDTRGIKSDWSKRTTPSSMSQTNINTTIDFIQANVAYEHITQLANIAKKDCWVNIPYDADSDYVSKMAQFYKSNLNADIKVMVETSNEMWNTGASFPAYAYFNDLANNNLQKTQDNIVYNIKRNWRIWKRVFGDRVEKVLGAQLGYPPYNDLYFNVANFTNNDKFEILAIAMYIDLDKQQSQIITSIGTDATAARVNIGALQTWRNRQFNDPSNSGLAAYSKAAKQSNAKLMIYDGNTEYLDNNSFNYKLLPKAEEAGMHKASLAPLFVAVFDTLKKYGVEAFTFSNVNGSKSSVNYAIMGGTFTNNTIVSNELTLDAKYQEVKEYISNQECLLSTVSEMNNENATVVVSPNPTSGHFQIFSSTIGADKMFVECYNSIGNLIFKGQLNVSEKIEILNNQPSGIYNLHLSIGDKNIVKKVMKE